MAVQAPNKVMAWDTGRGGAALHLCGDGVVFAAPSPRWRAGGISSFHAVDDATVDTLARHRRDRRCKAKAADAGAGQRQRHGQRREYNQSAQRVEARGAPRRARRAPFY